MAMHVVEPERAMLHGHFSPDLTPALTIDPGDSVRFRTLDASWVVKTPTSIDAEREKVEPREKGKDGGHCLSGPVAIKGAQPGMVLEVAINEIIVGDWGWAGGWGRPKSERIGVAEDEKCDLFWELDAETMTGESQLGHTIGLRPFMGVMGMPPAEPGVHSTGPPRTMGGNLDCKELVAGTTLYLPIAVEGGLFSTGDGHAVQGDGEVSGVAIECPMSLVDLTFNLHDDIQLTTPRARVAGGWITLGLHEDLNEATNFALKGMVELMCEQFDMSSAEAIAMASLVVDLRITQIVNGTKGVHAFLPDGAIQKA
jgi:acetamidase/formamidase